MKKHQERNWFRKHWVFVLTGLAIAAFVGGALALRPRAALELQPAPTEDAPIVVQWAGEWDPFPQFWGAYSSEAGEDLQSLPEEYKRFPVPRKVGEHVYIGGSLIWRGLDVAVQVPNQNLADLVVEHWDGYRWKVVGLDGTRKDWKTLDHGGKITLGNPKYWSAHTLTVAGEPLEAYWIRLSVTADLSEDLEGAASLTHNAPTLLVDGWQLRAHRYTACENRQRAGWSGKMISVRVRNTEGNPVPGIKVGFDTEPSRGIAYDHMNVWAFTDENGYVIWDSLGIPTQYRVWINDVLAVTNVGTAFGNEYCGEGRRNWRAINRPGIYSWALELRQQ